MRIPGEHLKQRDQCVEKHRGTARKSVWCGARVSKKREEEGLDREVRERTNLSGLHRALKTEFLLLVNGKAVK